MAVVRRKRGAPYGSIPRPIKTYVKRCMNQMIEKKAIDLASLFADNTPGTAGVVSPFGTFNIVQGTTDDTRTGNVIKLTSAIIRVAVTLEASNAQGFYRFCIFKDHQTNGATPATTDVFSTASSVRSGFNEDNFKHLGGARFTLLYDKLFALNAMLGIVGTTGTVNRAWTFRLNPKRLGFVRYDASAGAITDIVSGELFVAAVASSATDTIQASCQLTYQDA